MLVVVEVGEVVMSASSPPELVDGTTQGLDGDYEAFIEKKSACVLFSFFLFIITVYARLLNCVGVF